ncbi:phage terminase small subunit [Streptomyces bauhiniae]
MGAHGPIPKRSEERRRRNKDDGPELIQAPAGSPEDLPGLPDPDPLWHPIATDWYLSLRESGQAAFYEPSDWAVARYAAHVMSQVLQSERGPNGQLVAALNSVMSSLLTTEGDRRRARMELERKKPAGAKLASVSPLDSYRDIAGG